MNSSPNSDHFSFKKYEKDEIAKTKIEQKITEKFDFVSSFDGNLGT